MNNIYGYIHNDQFVETGRTEKGAKIAASKMALTDQDYVIVGYRSYINNMFIATAKRYNDDNQWFKLV